MIMSAFLLSFRLDILAQILTDLAGKWKGKCLTWRTHSKKAPQVLNPDMRLDRCEQRA